ncbi:MAG: UDP-N-acetylglucosamine 2-epimerase (non-hydrolyzing) [Oligoflexia bacterium]|nr:UDP-N-acetylglucosamine 2-epimerase (non-hydrolyzing) [Oligoflexia bacterium]
MKTVLVFAGTRPEIIKMAPLIRELRSRQSAVRTHFVFTGQHVEIALPFLKFFEIEPDTRLQLMNPNQSLGQLTSTAFLQFDEFLKQQSSVAALVQGDTTTAFAAALSCYYQHIPIGHVEAGLRTQNLNEPFPEEANRRMITRLASWNYAPTIKAGETLKNEQVNPESILVTGNTGIDALLWTAAQNFEPKSDELQKLKNQKLVLITLHRRENLEDRLEHILKAFVKLADQFKEIQFVMPVHPNPKVVVAAKKYLSGLANVHLVSPLDYPDFVWVMKKAELILSDSGGIQEEAPSLLKPVLVLRENTERPEAVEYGTSIMVGVNSESIVSTAVSFLTGNRSIKNRGSKNPYGDGTASRKIVDHLLAQI